MCMHSYKNTDSTNTLIFFFNYFLNFKPDELPQPLENILKREKKDMSQRSFLHLNFSMITGIKAWL